MKKNQLSLMALTFIAGIVIGISAIGLYSFTNRSVPQPLAPGVDKIGIPEASSLFRTYFENTAPSNEVVRGFAINREQLSALNFLANENPALTGFRLYMGYDSNAGNVGIIVGLNGSGKDETNSIYRTPGAASGPCPTICDGQSAIMGN